MFAIKATLLSSEILGALASSALLVEGLAALVEILAPPPRNVSRPDRALPSASALACDLFCACHTNTLKFSASLIAPVMRSNVGGPNSTIGTLSMHSISKPP